MPINSSEWLFLFENAFRGMSEKLKQVLQLSSCREHWVQAELSLHAWFQDEIEIWTDLPMGNGRKADLYALDESGKVAMVAEVKCLGDASRAKCLAGKWSVVNDINRLRSCEAPTRLFVLVIAAGEQESNVGRRLRSEAWADGQEVAVDLGFALIRMWSL